MQTFPFKQKFDLYYTGYFGKQKVQTSEDWSNKTNKITALQPIDSALELFSVISAIPPFQDVQSGFTYYWFKSDRSPSWESCPDACVLEYKHEERDEFAQENPDEWMKTKCRLEARVIALLALWMGGSNEAFSEGVLGVVIKIRRARVTVQLWYEGAQQDAKGPFAAVFECKQMALTNMTMAEVRESSSRRGSRASSRTSSQSRSGDYGKKRDGDRDKRRDGKRHEQ